MIRFTVYSILFLGLSAGLKAQHHFRITVQSENGLPLSGVELYFHELDHLVKTDNEGKFDLQCQRKRLKMSLFLKDYQSQTLNLSSDENPHTVVLSKMTAQLDEVMVKAEGAGEQRRNLREVEGTSIYAAKKSEVLKLKNLNLDLGVNNPRQIYAQITGLNIYEGSAGSLQLNIGGRGLDPNRSSNFNVRQNGYDISADVLGYPESYYTPPAEALQEVKLVKGAASLQYGTQFGGLLEFKMKEPGLDTSLAIELRNSYGSFGRYNGYISLSGSKGKWSYFTYFNYKEGAAWQNNGAYSSRNAFADIRYQINDEHRLSLEISYLNYWAKQSGGLTDSQFERKPNLSQRDRNWFQVDWQLYALKHRWEVSPQDLIETQLFRLVAQRNALGFRGLPQAFNLNPITTPDEKDLEGSYIHPRDLIKGEFSNWGWESRWLHRYKQAGERRVFLLGLKYYQAANRARQGAGSKAMDADFSFRNREFFDYPSQSDFLFPNQNVALFSEHIWYLGKNWSITPGLRAEWIKTESAGSYQNLLFDNAGNLIFRDTLRDDRVLERAFLLAGIGLSYRWEAQTESYFNLSQNYRSVTFSDIRTVNPSFIIDPKIGDESGFTADLGTRVKWDNIELDASLFALYYDNRIGIVLNDRAQRVRKNIGTALIHGLELYWRQRFLPKAKFNWSYFANLAYTRSVYLRSEEANVIGKKVEFIPDLNLKLGLEMNYANLQASLQITHLSQQYTDVENSARPEEGDIREGIIGPIPAYQVLDFNLSYRQSKWEIGVSVNNLLNETYFTRRATGYPGPGIIPSDPRTFSLFGVYSF